MLDGIITTTQGSDYLDEFIVEMIGNTKGNYRNVNFVSHGSPFNSVIADMLRVACYNASGKPGMVVYGHFRKKGNFVYTIVVFSQETADKLRYEGANLAIDMNRPRVRNLLHDGPYTIMDQLQKVFKIPSDLDLGPNLLKFSIDSGTNDELFGLFLKITKIILGKKRNLEKLLKPFYEKLLENQSTCVNTYVSLNNQFIEHKIRPPLREIRNDYVPFFL